MPNLNLGAFGRVRTSGAALKAEPLLARLKEDVPRLPGNKPVVFVWGMKDPAFRPKQVLPRARAAFADHEVVELHHASHYIQEDAPEEIAQAIRRRFGPRTSS